MVTMARWENSIMCGGSPTEVSEVIKTGCHPVETGLSFKIGPDC
jgi:hypothetical protein